MPLDPKLNPVESEAGELLPGPPAGGPGSMRDWAQQLVSRARDEDVALTGEEGLLTSMVKEVLQAGLDVELSDHLGYEHYEPSGRGTGNSRNGVADGWAGSRRWRAVPGRALQLRERRCRSTWSVGDDFIRNCWKRGAPDVVLLDAGDPLTFASERVVAEIERHFACNLPATWDH